MISEVTRTCKTCPFARHLDGDRYVCSATHNHHNPVTRGHWEATADCELAIQAEEGGLDSNQADAGYVMALEASLEKSESQVFSKSNSLKLPLPHPVGLRSIPSSLTLIASGPVHLCWEPCAARHGVGWHALTVVRKVGTLPLAMPKTP